MIKSMKKVIGIVLGMAVLAGIGYYFYQSKAVGSESFGAAINYNYPGPRATSTNIAYNLIGTRVGTTTTGVYFSDGTATTSYPIIITKAANEATLLLYAVSASSTGAHAALSIFGSNDFDCDTASTSSGTLNNMTTGAVMWFDIGNNVSGLAGSQTITNASSTISWSPTTSLGKAITITDLHYDCIKVDVNASSTIMHAQIITNNLNEY